MANTDLWDRLGKTDPKHTKGFKRAGGFSGTAIKPIYSYRRMTEEYGPCGIGWGVGEPSFQTVPAPEGEVLVYCTVSIWHGDRANIVFGVGGDKAVIKQSSGLRSDDEAFKKAFTDAVTNALKLIGVAADVHMGLFEDNKYVNEIRQEFSTPAPKRANPHVTRPEDVLEGTDQDVLPHQNIDVAPLSKAKANPVFKALQDELWQTGTLAEMEHWSFTNKDKLSQLPNDWYQMMRGIYVEHKSAILALEAGDDNRMAG